MQIYLISLKNDNFRREVLENQFPRTFSNFKIIDAINGREANAGEYFNNIRKFFKKTKRLLTPSEVGCTLSHLKALNSFLESNDKYALILEDDIQGNDQDILDILNIVDSIRNLDGVFIFGGQEGFDFNKYILGKPFQIKKSNYMYYEVSKFSQRFILRTCCYVVNREIAQYILSIHEDCLRNADAWSTMLELSSYRMYYANYLRHPVDLTDSTIERERESFYEYKFLKRIYKQGILWKIFNKIYNEFYRLILLILGFKNIFKEK